MKSIFKMVGFGIKTVLCITIVTTSVTVGIECSAIAIDATRKYISKIRKKVNDAWNTI